MAETRAETRIDERLHLRALPVGGVGRIGVGWWGLMSFIAGEAALFGYLIFSYAYLAISAPPAGIRLAELSFQFSLPMTVIAIASAIAIWWGEQGIRRNNRADLTIGSALACLLGIGFIILEVVEWRSVPITPQSSAVGSAFFAVTGLHLLHVVAGVIALAFLTLWSALGYFDRYRNTHVLVTAAYWYFVNAAWIVFFVAIYVVPHLGGR